MEKRGFADYLWRFMLFLWALTIIFPMFWILFEALKTNQEFFAGIWTMPTTLQWKNFSKAFIDFNIGVSLLNTVYYVFGGLIISTTLTTLNAYALTRLEFRGRKIIWSIIMASLFLPGINALIPQFVLMKSLHLTNSLTGLIILNSLGESVFFLLLIGGFMQSLPKEIEESAHMDGASLLQVFFKIIVPLTVPGIVTVAIFKFMGLYNDFLGPFIYLSDQSKYTIGVNMYAANKLMQYKADWVSLFAGVIIALVPSVVMFITFQKRIMEGATLGAVKG